MSISLPRPRDHSSARHRCLHTTCARLGRDRSRVRRDMGSTRARHAFNWAETRRVSGATWDRLGRDMRSTGPRHAACQARHGIGSTATCVRLRRDPPRVGDDMRSTRLRLAFNWSETHRVSGAIRDRLDRNMCLTGSILVACGRDTRSTGSVNGQGARAKNPLRHHFPGACGATSPARRRGERRGDLPTGMTSPSPACGRGLG